MLRAWWTAKSLFVPVLGLRKDEETKAGEKTCFVLLSFENTFEIIVLSLNRDNKSRGKTRSQQQLLQWTEDVVNFNFYSAALKLFPRSRCGRM